MVTKKQQAKAAQQKQPEDNTALTVNKKACLNDTPEKLKRKDGNPKENGTMVFTKRKRHTKDDKEK